MFWRRSLPQLLAQAGQVLGLEPRELNAALPLIRAVFRHGGVLGVARGGRQLLWPFGQVAPQGVFELASVTKPFTAALTATLIQQGRLDWTTPLSQLGGPLGGLPRQLNARALTTHTSGLPPHPARTVITSLTQYNNPYGSLSAPAVLASASRWANAAQFGQYRYSNLGMGVLALALAYAAGQPATAEGFAAALEEEVLSPLGLRTIAWQPDGQPLVRPYSLLGGHQTTSFAELAGAGGLFGTASELLTFADAHLQGRLSGYWRHTLTPPGLSWPRTAVAPGWFQSGPIAWHDGIARGTRSALGFHPATGAQVVLLVRGGLPSVGGQHDLVELLLALLGVRGTARSGPGPLSTGR